MAVRVRFPPGAREKGTRRVPFFRALRSLTPAVDGGDHYVGTGGAR